MSRVLIVVLLYHLHKLIDLILECRRPLFLISVQTSCVQQMYLKKNFELQAYDSHMFMSERKENDLIELGFLRG
jgi:hypothetical protein